MPRVLTQGVSSLALALVLVGVAPVEGGVVPSATSTATGFAWPGGQCPDVRVLFARGSGEAPKKSSDISNYNAGNDWGMGSVGASFREKLGDVTTGTGLNIGYEGVVYDALPVPIADPSTWSDPEAMAKYQGSVSRGADAIKERVDDGPGLRCPVDRIPVILGGYSQGAWAVRRALNTMSSAQLEAVDAVVLFGDPTKRWQESIVRWRRTVQMALPEGIAVTALQTGPDDGVLPASIQQRTSSYCIPGDIVCGGWDFSTILHRQYGLETTYKAAQFVKPELPVAPAQLPGVRDAAETYSFLRGGSRDVLWDLGSPDWWHDCRTWRDFTALSGRWVSYYTADGHMAYFQGYQDPGVFVWKFRTASAAREAFERQRAFVSRCEGAHTWDDGSWGEWDITAQTVPDLGDGTVSYKQYEISENVLTGYSEHRERMIAIRSGRLLLEVSVQAEYYMPSRKQLLDFARTALTTAR